MIRIWFFFWEIVSSQYQTGSETLIEWMINSIWNLCEKKLILVLLFVIPLLWIRLIKFLVWLSRPVLLNHCSKHSYTFLRELRRGHVSGASSRCSLDLPIHQRRDHRTCCISQISPSTKRLSYIFFVQKSAEQKKNTVFDSLNIVSHSGQWY